MLRLNFCFQDMGCTVYEFSNNGTFFQGAHWNDGEFEINEGRVFEFPYQRYIYDIKRNDLLEEARHLIFIGYGVDINDK